MGIFFNRVKGELKLLTYKPITTESDLATVLTKFTEEAPTIKRYAENSLCAPFAICLNDADQTIVGCVLMVASEIVYQLTSSFITEHNYDKAYELCIADLVRSLK